MARTFASSSSQYLYGGITTSLIVGSPPITMGGWMTKNTSGAGTDTVLVQYSGSSKRYMLNIKKIVSPSGYQAQAVIKKSLIGQLTLSGSLASGGTVWHHVLLVSADANDHKLYIDGVQAASNTASWDPAMTSGTTRVGRDYGSVYYDGSAEWLAIWNVALSPNEIVALANGIPPWEVRPEALANGNGACWPLESGSSPEPNLTGVNSNWDLTLSGSPTTSDGPPVHFLRTPIWA